jgi:hypothetical protein
MAEYELHEYSLLFPKMTDAEFSSLVEDVKEHGVREPVTLYGGKVIEGRHRMLAALRAGCSLPTKVFEGTDAEALALVTSANLARRHLTDDQRARTAAKIANMRQGERTDLVPIGTKISQTKAAEMMKVPVRTVKKAKQIIDHGTEELNDLHERGEVSTSAAEIVAKFPEPEQHAIVAEGPAAIVKAAVEARASVSVKESWPADVLRGEDVHGSTRKFVKDQLVHVALADDGTHGDVVANLGVTLDFLEGVVGDVVDDFRGDEDLYEKIAEAANA